MQEQQMVDCYRNLWNGQSRDVLIRLANLLSPLILSANSTKVTYFGL